MFDRILDILAHRSAILRYQNVGSPWTQVILGEYHYVPRVQADLLELLCELQEETAFSLLGAEGVRQRFRVPPKGSIDLARAQTDIDYMREWCRRRIRACALFASMYGERVDVCKLDDPLLWKLSGDIDKRCSRLYRLRREDGTFRSQKHEDQFQIWTDLFKNILLGARSASWVKTLHRLQQERGASLAVMVCGLSHTPICKAYEPFSVWPAISTLPINAVVAIPDAAWTLWEEKGSQRDPFDYYRDTSDFTVKA